MKSDYAKAGKYSNAKGLNMRSVLEIDEYSEKTIQFVQSTYIMVALFQLYETGRLLLEYWQSTEMCPESTLFLFGLALLNALWVAISIFGVSSIQTQETKRVQLFQIVIIIFGLMRGAFYICSSSWLGLMEKYQGQCENIYDSHYYNVVAILEFLVIVIFFIEARKALEEIKKIQSHFQRF